MPQSLAFVPVHFVFSTKFRQPLITEEVRNELYPYIGGILRNHGCPPIQIGGVEDHIHLLFPLSRTATAAQMIGTVKSETTKWIKGRWPQLSEFAWQAGYGAFGVGIREVDAVVKYIQAQRNHHLSTSFQEEYLSLLAESGIPYDSDHIWD